MPELSYGSHLFLDLVETGIFYAALFDGSAGTVFNPKFITKRENFLPDVVPGSDKFKDVVHIARIKDLLLCSDIVSQMVICQ